MFSVMQVLRLRLRRSSTSTCCRWIRNECVRIRQSSSKATIVSIRRCGQSGRARDATKIDGGGTTYLLPGLADRHTHVEEWNDLVLVHSQRRNHDPAEGSATLMDQHRLRQILAERQVVGPYMYSSFLTTVRRAVGSLYVETPMTRATLCGWQSVTATNSSALHSPRARSFWQSRMRLANKASGSSDTGVRAVAFQKRSCLGQSMVAHAEEFYLHGVSESEDEKLIPSVVAEDSPVGGLFTPNRPDGGDDAQWGKPEQVKKFLADPRALP